MMYPLVLDLAALGIAVAVPCRALGFSKQAFYAWKKCPVTQRDWDDAHLIHAAREIHADDPEFGYRFIGDELAAQGLAAGENRVARLCADTRRDGLRRSRLTPWRVRCLGASLRILRPWTVPYPRRRLPPRPSTRSSLACSRSMLRSRPVTAWPASTGCIWRSLWR